MRTFTTFLTEQKNLHLEHLEDELFNRGEAGVNEAIAFLKSLSEMLKGNAKSPVNVTVKWDGAPAVFVGTNPENGKFFVATKSLFNKTPKINYTNADIDRNHSGGLADKLKVALASLKGLGIKGVLQGDMLYTTGDLSSQTIDGESMLTFTPNTITYAVPSNSGLASKINSSQMGIVFHTTYSGDTIENLKASFGANVSGLKKTKKVWYQDADYRDVSGRATMTAKQEREIQNYIKGTERIVKGSKAALKKIVNSPLKDLIKIYLNQNVRAGIDKGTAGGLASFLGSRFDTKISSLKTDKARERVQQEKDDLMKELKRNERSLDGIFTAHYYLAQAKMLILKKLQALNTMPSFIKTDSGYKVTNPEGFVAIDRTGKAVKLVDRMEFSRANFNVAKDWTK
tara:strand:- start:936 stop:2132 length:1197 start_codon:yes stop_codon:yes gene_type:complete